MRSLVVEDNFICRKTLSLLLRQYGECDIATDGLEALEAVRIALDEDIIYDLICLDIQMPNLDGHACLKGIRDQEQQAGILLGYGSKVIMTTAQNDKVNVMAAFRENADGYLVKPVTRKPLVEIMDKLGVAYAVSD